MIWQKKGLIFAADGQYPWMHSYTTPVAAVVLSSGIRVFFSSRSKQDEAGNFISYASFLDVDRSDPSRVIYLHDRPLLDLGARGSFDEHGTMIAKPAICGSDIYLYYMGWKRISQGTAPYEVSLGLAISKDDGLTFQKATTGCILGIDAIDPISIGNVSVLRGEARWRMWYTSYTRWVFGGVKPTPTYEIKYAESSDGIRWEKTGTTCIAEGEGGGVATPTVLNRDGHHHMWFGCRPPLSPDGSIQGYGMAYACSNDGILWTRDDTLAGIAVSREGWDSEMICYPHVIEVDGRILMFYCGNGFGLAGFGYAELVPGSLLPDSDTRE